MKMLPKRTLCLASGLVVVCATLSATTFFYEGFQTPGTYTDGATIAGTGGWVKNNGNSDIVATTDSMSYETTGVGSLTTTNGSALRATGNSGLYQNLRDVTDYKALGNTIWYSLLLERISPSTGIVNIVFGQSASNVTGWRLSNENVSDSTFHAATRLTNTGGDTWSANGAAFSNDVSNLLVARMTWDAGSGATSQDVTIDAWVNPDLDADLASVGVGAANITVTGTIFTGSIAVKLNTTGGYQLDEIRIANSQGEVMPYSAVPEPSVAALGLGMATVLLTAVRRRRTGTGF